MNILHILHVNHLGNGITSVVLELSKAQRLLDHNVRVLNLRSNAMDIPEFMKCPDSNEFQKQLIEFIPDIVIFHGVFYKQIRKYSQILRTQNIPYIFEPHGAYSFKNYKKSQLKKLLFWNLYFKKALFNSKGLIFLNENERQNFAIDFKNLSSYIVPNGSYENQDFRLSNVKGNESVTFLYLSRIDINHKGLDILMEAIRLLEKDGELNNVCFKFYGPGHESDLRIFKGLIANMPENISYYGPIYGDEKDSVIRNADIFILTSRYEGFPMSILEALSYGCPCLVSKGTNVAEIIEDFDAGWVVESLNPIAVADMIKTAIKDYSKKYDSLRKNAKCASEEYLWDKIAKKSIEVYLKVLNDK